MPVRDYYNAILNAGKRPHPRFGQPRFDEARRDYADALRARARI